MKLRRPINIFSAMSALPPLTDIGRRIYTGIRLSVYEYTP
jgi:hypothetical protein